MNIDTSEGGLIHDLIRLDNIIEEARLDRNVYLNLRSADKTVLGQTPTSSESVVRQHIRRQGDSVISFLAYVVSFEQFDNGHDAKFNQEFIERCNAHRTQDP